MKWIEHEGEECPVPAWKKVIAENDAGVSEGIAGGIAWRRVKRYIVIEEMTPRDIFAAAVLQGNITVGSEYPERIASLAYKVADAMMKEREVRQTSTRVRVNESGDVL